MTYVGSISWADDAGWHMKEISPFPGAAIMTGDASAAIGVIALQTSILLPSLSRARETANRVKCASDERQLGQALLLYANDHQGKYPDSYEEFIEYAVKDMQVAHEVFVCPSSGVQLPQTFKRMEPAEFAKWAAENSSYVYLAKGKTTSSGAEDILMYEKLTNHDNDGINILYADCHVEFQGRPQAEQELQRVGAGDPNQPPPPPPAPKPRRKGGL
jgi:prepilin-type processing-associated H-X9-DG protein